MTAPLDQTVAIGFTLNGKAVERTVPTSTLLVDLLRTGFQLRGTKEACGRAVCGACTVLIDGIPAVSCAKFAFEVDGTAVTTVEGLAGADGELDPVQQAFLNNSAFQCGYCTAGMMMVARALLDHDPDPDEETITAWISSNICRCASYKMIIEAIQEAAKAIRTADTGGSK